MAVNCSRCGIQLYGAEIACGVCEHCQAGEPPTSVYGSERRYDLGYQASKPSNWAEHGVGLDTAWKPVYTGLRLHVAALASLIIAYALGLLLAASMIMMGIGLAVRGPGDRSGVAALGCLGLIGGCFAIALMVGTVVLFVVGSCFFVACPPVGRLRLYAILNVLCVSALIVVPILGLFFLGYVPDEALPFLYVTSQALQLLAMLGIVIGFFAFLRRVARYFDRAMLATQFLLWPMVYVGLVSLTAGAMAIGDLLAAQGGVNRFNDELQRSTSLVLAVGLVSLLVLGLVIWLLVLVERLRLEVSRSLPRSAVMDDE